MFMNWIFKSFIWKQEKQLAHKHGPFKTFQRNNLNEQLTYILYKLIFRVAFLNVKGHRPSANLRQGRKTLTVLVGSF